MSETKDVAVRQESPIERLKKSINSDSVQQQFKNALADNAPLFIASLIDVYASDTYLQKCAPNLVIMEALKAATLKLPINKNLGFAYIVPYDKSKKVGKEWVKESIPQFQIGYRGYIQLAQRTGQYRYINADAVYEGELKGINKITGDVDLSGAATGTEVVGYFAYIELITGFKKTVYWPKEKVENHAKSRSSAYKNDIKNENAKSPWSTDFDAMAIKTLLRHLLGKYGVMTVEMSVAFAKDESEKDTSIQDDINQNANQGPVVDITPEPDRPGVDDKGTPGLAEASTANDLANKYYAAKSLQEVMAIKVNKPEVGEHFDKLMELREARINEFNEAAGKIKRGPGF